MLSGVIALLSVLYFGYLFLERRLAAKNRSALKHVIHVNGIRGKSTVTRMIYAGLREGGWKVVCKTTGTLPRYLDPAGNEHDIRRRGKANIREQLTLLRISARLGADILVAECMAVNPEYQYISQHRMLQADIGVITNVRLDHTDVLGNSTEEIAGALANTIPYSGALFTAAAEFMPQFEAIAAKVGSQAFLSSPDKADADFDFPENVALALQVCTYLGVDERTALRGIRNYPRDPYALSVYRLPAGGLFIGGFSINDPESTRKVWAQLLERYHLQDKKLVILLNNRSDRGVRTKAMAECALGLSPDWILVAGAGERCVRRLALKRGVPVHRAPPPGDAVLSQIDSKTVLLALGNLARQGKQWTDYVAEKGDLLVPSGHCIGRAHRRDLC